MASPELKFSPVRSAKVKLISYSTDSSPMICTTDMESSMPPSISSSSVRKSTSGQTDSRKEIISFFILRSPHQSCPGVDKEHVFSADTAALKLTEHTVIALRGVDTVKRDAAFFI